MSNTRSNLTAAQIYKVKNGAQVGAPIFCMFNPFEYSVSKTNNYSEDAKKGNVPHVEFSKAGPQTLKLELYFDSYESEEDISKTTVKLWELMETTEENQKTKKLEPPEVAFEWGVFKFVAFVTNMSQKFTLFKKDGTPVRAKVDITFTQYKDAKDYKHQNPTSGGGDIEQVWQVVAGDRLDAIAYQVYGEATKWRVIAETNRLRNPFVLTPGQKLVIPMLGE